MSCSLHVLVEIWEYSGLSCQNQIKSYLYDPVSQITNLAQGALQSVQQQQQQSLSLDPESRSGKSSLKTLSGKKMSETSKGQQRKDPPSRTDRQEIDVVRTERSNLVHLHHKQLK